MERYSRPNSESVDKESASPPANSPKRFPWGGRYTSLFRRKQCDSPTSPAPSPKRTPKRSSVIDAQTLLDAQSPGLAFRANKYYEESHQKSPRPLINPRYTRIGDFPIVNLDKDKHKRVIQVQPSQSTAITTRITPPVRSNYFMQSRAEIMSGGRSAMSTTDSQTYKNGSHTPANENEPLVSHEGEYETAPTRSVLDALKEISRKRIHCEVSDSVAIRPIVETMYSYSLNDIFYQDLDEEQHKKIRPEIPQNVTIEHIPSASDINAKRSREKTSPNTQT